MISASQPVKVPEGPCSVCHGVFKLKLDGSVRRHGGKSKGKECPGSHISSGVAFSSQPPSSLSVLVPQPTASAQANHAPIPAVDSDALDFISHGARYRLVEHIPRSAREACSSLLSSLLDKVCANYQNVQAWADLLSFGPAVLGKPPRGGRKSNITKLIKNRVNAFSGPSGLVPPVPNSHPTRSRSEVLAAAVSSKIEQGNLKAAVRLVCSDEAPAPPNIETADKLRAKHPKCSADRRSLPPRLDYSLSVTQLNVSSAIKSFPNGSSGGTDCLRPQHLKDLASCREARDQLLTSICDFVNLLLEGICPPEVQSILFGGNLLALSKKDGGIRPIAVGSVWRRLAAKCANTFASESMAARLSPIQLGVGVKGGAEAAIHSARRYVGELCPGSFVIKLDFSNAFNSLRRDTMLETVHREVPEIYNFCHLSYSKNSTLFFNDFIISSEEGPQQGDPLGPLLFASALHPILKSLNSEFILGYLDDVTAGGDAAILAEDFVNLRDQAAEAGLLLNIKKCEIIGSVSDPIPSCFAGFRRIPAADCELLGVPLFSGSVLDASLASRCFDLARAGGRLGQLSAHDALLILTHAISAPKLMYTLRCSPCSGHPELDNFDLTLRGLLSTVTNVDIDDLAWIQAGLPVGRGGLGIRSVALLAPSAFLASAAATLDLQSRLLPAGFDLPDPARDFALNIWSSRYNAPLPVESDQVKQKAWDKASVEAGLSILFSKYQDPYHKARLLASQADHSGDWLHAWPITSCGLRLDNEAIRVAVGLRLGSNLCSPHVCPCGTQVDSRGSHGLSCRRSAGRQCRHAQLNDAIQRALARAGIPAVKEPVGLMRSGDGRPDGVTLTTWEGGKCLAWDATVPDTLAPSHLADTSAEAGAAAAKAASLKNDKYLELSRGYTFCAIAIETLGPINEDGIKFLSKLGQKISELTGDPRETSFLFQRLSIIVQRCNAICFSGTFECFWPAR